MRLKFIAFPVMSSVFLILTVVFLGLPVLSAYSQETVGAQGTRQPLHRQTDEGMGNNCFVYVDYTVVTTSSEDVGEEIRLYKRGMSLDSRRACANTKGQPYIKIENTDANYFFGLTKDKLLIDSGTSAGPRGLSIVSLNSKKVVYSTQYNEVVKVLGNTLVYNKPSNTEGSLKNCPEASKWRKQGGGVAWVRSTRLDLASLKESPIGQITCVYAE